MSGQRRYTHETIHRLTVLRLAQACGFLVVLTPPRVVSIFCRHCSGSGQWKTSALTGGTCLA